MHAGQKVVIGVGGNIGTGKTTVAKIFSDLGGKYIAADEIGWRVLPEITDVLKREFGKKIMSGGKIDKGKLRDLVFSDAHDLEFLNRTSHPILTKRIIDEAKAVKSGIVVVDAALLFDWPDVYEMTDYSILVKAQRETMLSRAKSKGIGDQLFERIVSKQKSEQEMMTMASYVVENNGTMAELREKCKEIYEEINDDC
jgi:dephospho-CoA kinase